MNAEDVAAIVALYESMDERDGYLRFFAARPRNFSTLVAKIAALDERHAAVGAFESGQLIGVAGLAHLDDPGTAEVAMVVRHDRQLHGIGTMLLQHLAAVAVNRGIHTLVAEVLFENTAMLNVIAATGLPTTQRQDGTVVDIAIDLQPGEQRPSGKDVGP